MTNQDPMPKLKRQYHCCGGELKGHSVAGIWKCDYCTRSCHAPNHLPQPEGGWEEKLEDENTPLGQFQKLRTEVISEMFDGKYANGIYPTSRCFARLDDCVRAQIAAAEERGMQKGLNWNNPDILKARLEEARKSEREKVVKEAIERIESLKSRLDNSHEHESLRSTHNAALKKAINLISSLATNNREVE